MRLLLLADDEKPRAAARDPLQSERLVVERCRLHARTPQQDLAVAARELASELAGELS